MAEGGEFSSLETLFKKGFEAQRRLQSDDLSSTSDEGKACVEEGIGCLEQATRLANQLDLFSKNETLEDVTSTNLKYILLPALLGDLTLQVSATDRLDTIQKARVYFVDYLQRSKSYAVTSEDPPPLKCHVHSSETPAANFEKLAAERTAKIQKYKQQKELERKLKELTISMESPRVSPSHQVEEEVLREHSSTLLRFWVYRCQDHVQSIDQEVLLLQEMEKRKKEPREKGRGLNGKATPMNANPKVKPIVITREMLQAKVYGAGYPSLPTMTVEEFYEQKYKEELEARRRDGLDLPDHQRKRRDLSLVGGHGEPEVEEEVEDKEEDDSEEALKKARDWDEFKDDNRRGWGNKKNMG